MERIDSTLRLKPMFDMHTEKIGLYNHPCHKDRVREGESKFQHNCPNDIYEPSKDSCF